MKFFKRKNVNKSRPLPTWDETVEIMRNEYLNYGDKIIDVISSTDGAHSFVILKSDCNHLTYSFESLKLYEPEFMKYCDDNEIAYWQLENSGAKPIFDDMEILIRELAATPEYKLFFKDK